MYKKKNPEKKDPKYKKSISWKYTGYVFMKCSISECYYYTEFWYRMKNKDGFSDNALMVNKRFNTEQ